MQNKKRILLIEDETDLRELYQSLLEEENYEVVSVADGRVGLNEIKKGGYNLVLLDIMLPFLDGLEILENVSTEKNPKQPIKTIVLLTNLAQDQTIAKAMEFGVRGYMVKSDYDPEQLLETIASFLKNE
jgi:DNA-binding response OmpR family regulator